MTASRAEMAMVESGPAGAGWMRTGRAFAAFGDPRNCTYGCVPVHRFYAPGPNSHFFTVNEAEAQMLRRPNTGWLHEGVAFYAAPPEPGCAVPVYRLYNDRWRFNDSNHRFTTSVAARDELVARGWIDEGTAFCATRVDDLVLRELEFSIAPSVDSIRPALACQGVAMADRSCVEVSNLPLPVLRYSPDFSGVTDGFHRPSDEFSQRTGLDIFDFISIGGRVDNYFPATLPAQLAWRGLFVQLTGMPYLVAAYFPAGETGTYTGVSFVHKVADAPPRAGEQDARLFPWRNADGVDVDFQVVAGLLPRTLSAQHGGQAYGHVMVEFVDSRSGHRFDFALAAYGTLGESDFLGRDVKTGKVIVATRYSPDNRYARAEKLGAASASSAVAYFARISRTEFRRIVEDAKRLEPALSLDPSDYAVGNVRVQNEVYGAGEIGILQTSLRATLLTR